MIARFASRQGAGYPFAIRRVMLAPMRSVLRFAFWSAVPLATFLTASVLGVTAGCGEHVMVWFCLNPVTGKVDDSIYDAENFVNGEPDPCHCYDPCGPAKTCPIEVDAGTVGPGCSTGDAGNGG